MDIFTPANNAVLGDGWFPLEIYGAEKFRWASNGAEIYVAALRAVRHYLQIYLEPGPSLDYKQFELLISENGESVGRVMVKGRQMISVELAATPPAVRKLVLNVEDGDKLAPNDTRVLNFRVFKLSFVQAIVDILPPESSARPGSGWYPLEIFNGETFRWAGNDAKIRVSDPLKIQTLPLEIEPGPGVGSRPFMLRVLDNSGTQLVETEITGRQSISIPMPAGAKESLSLTLRAQGGGKQIASDQRIMNFRAFQYSPDLKTSATCKT